MPTSPSTDKASEKLRQRTKSLFSVDFTQPQDIIVFGQKIEAILATSYHISQTAEKRSSNFDSLVQISGIAESLWDKIRILPIADLPSINHLLDQYKSTLTELCNCINDNTLTTSVAERYVRLLCTFRDEIQTATQSNTYYPAGESPSSTHIFQNAHHIAIFGGSFTQNVADIEVRKQNVGSIIRGIIQLTDFLLCLQQQILRLQYLIILFS